MTIRYHDDLIQGSDEWHAARCGLLTASEMDRILTPKLKVAENVKSRAHLWECAAQRISRYVEPQYISDSMLRGHEDEILARALYSEKRAPVTECGFVTNDKWGFTLGGSPDGLVGDDGLIECKSRCQKYQVQTIVEEWTGVARVPEDFMLQIQSLLLVTGRKWCDFISYSGGLPMAVVRAEIDTKAQDAILEAAAKFEARINEVVADFHDAVKARGHSPTDRRVEVEMFI